MFELHFSCHPTPRPARLCHGQSARLLVMLHTLVLGMAMAAFAADTPPAPFTRVAFGLHYPKHIQHQTFNGKSYIALSGLATDEPLIWSVDLATGAWEGPFQIGTNDLPLPDQHGNPSLLVDNDGYIHVWYGGHGFITSTHVYARSAKPGDISSWVHPEFETLMTYPFPAVMNDGTIYTIYRHGNHSMPGSAAWIFRTSTDNGMTWSDSTTLVQRMTNDSESDCYIRVEKLHGQDRFAITVSDEYLPGSPSVHTTSHLFMFYYDHPTGTFSNVAGKQLHAENGLSIDLLRKHCLVADYDALGNYHKRIAGLSLHTGDGTVYVYAGNGNPAGFIPRPADFNPMRKWPKMDKQARRELSYGGRPRIWRWDGQQWQHADPPIRIGSPMVIDGQLHGWGRNGDDRLQLLRTDDHGASWQPVMTLPDMQPGDRWVSVLTNTGSRPADPRARAVLYESQRWTQGDAFVGGRAWLWGDRGFLAPPAPLDVPQRSQTFGYETLISGFELSPAEDALTYRLATKNPLPFDLSLAITPLPDNPPGWVVLTEPETTVLSAGESRDFVIEAREPVSGPRYPLPGFLLEVTPTDPTIPVLSNRRVYLLPVAGHQTRVRIARCENRPVIDGRLDDPSWQREPTAYNMASMRKLRDTEPTRVWMTYDDQGIYAAWRCDRTTNKSLKLKAKARDSAVFANDSVELMLSPTAKPRPYYQLVVNAANVVYDGKVFDKRFNLEGLVTETRITDDYWLAEAAIPWSAMGLDGPPKQARFLVGRNAWTRKPVQILQFPWCPKGNHQASHHARLFFD